MPPIARSSGTFDNEFERGIDTLVREQEHRRTALDFERDELNVYRSGSAPPTVEGSETAFGSLFGHVGSTEPRRAVHRRDARAGLSDEEVRLHPVDLSYCYSNARSNPLMQPPAISKEAWRARQRFGAGASSFGGSGDHRGRKGYLEDDVGNGCFSSQLNFPKRSGQVESVEMVEVNGNLQENTVYRKESEEGLPLNTDRLIGLPGVGIGTRRKGFADDELCHGASAAGHISFPVSLNAFDDIYSSRLSGSPLRQLNEPSDALDGVQYGVFSPSLDRCRNFGPSLARSTDSGSPSIQKLPHLSLPPVGLRFENTDVHFGIRSNDTGSISSNIVDCNDTAAALLELNLSKTRTGREAHLWRKHNQAISAHRQIPEDKGAYKLDSETSGNSLDQFTGRSGTSIIGGTAKDAIFSKLAYNGQINLPNESIYSSLYKQTYSMDRTSLMGPKSCGLPAMIHNQFDPDGQYAIGTENELKNGHKGYMGNLLAQQKGQYVVPVQGQIGDLNNCVYGHHAHHIGMTYPASQISTPIRSLMDPANSMRPNEQLFRVPSSMRSSPGTPLASWSSDNRVMGDGFSSSFLEEFKINKTRSFKLSDIVGHALEFSKDQFGSRFIQQKLETASVGEKNMIFPEIISSAHALMTDVFGNYVIQKFFEQGTEIQRKELAVQLIGHVLPLSLQMYGCRVIQKALEVVVAEEQALMVLELDGQIMKCVRDQNGNHVIQKCIESIPLEKINFIIEAFYGQVASLSTHPYGCRVIQRVLEHINNPEVQSIMINEIMKSVCILAQDQYGNYVIQHVLQHGRPQDRSAIICKLAGQIVRMSQQKYASNVVEKCLTYGTAEERQLLINEMLGATDENESFQAMMKDQFANYVVQKVLETCDEKDRELILSRIRVHLNALKKYTYGKHIVARVEKLVAAGEKHIGVSLCSS